MKALQFALAVTLIIGSSNRTKLKAEDNFGPLPHIYSLQNDTSFCHKLNERTTKSAKDDVTEVETGIWYNATAGLIGEEFRLERHGIIFE